ncbi:MAG: hypothetical protein GY778_30920, partial [bacterium]|nr:hypothetical protein [bacterium]
MKQMPDGASSADVAAEIGPGLATAALGAVANFGNGGVTLDLRAPLTGDCKLALLTSKSPESLDVLRHSTAHVMAEAICRIWPQTRLVYGPTVEGGFYYDIHLDKKLTPDDFPAIEAEMKKIVAEDRPFTRYEMGRDEGLAKVRAEGNPFFSEELAYALRDAGLIRVAGGRCHLAPEAEDLSGLDFPETIEGVITSRIDRLSAAEQLTVKVA